MYPDERLVRAALNGPNGEVLRLLALQPVTSRLPSCGPIPVVRK